MTYEEWKTSLPKELTPSVFWPKSLLDKTWRLWGKHARTKYLNLMKEGKPYETAPWQAAQWAMACMVRDEKPRKG